MEAILYKLIELVQQTAPELWKIAIRQAYADGWKDMIISFFLFLFAVAALRASNRIVTVYHNRWDNIKREVGKKYVNEADVFEEKAGYVIAFMLCWFGFAVFFINGFMRFVNPPFYAIKILLGLISK